MEKKILPSHTSALKKNILQEKGEMYIFRLITTKKFVNTRPTLQEKLVFWARGNDIQGKLGSLGMNGEYCKW